MVYVEIKERNGRKYYYLTESVRKGRSIKKKRQYIGIDLTTKELAYRNKNIKKEKRIKRNVEKIKSKIIKILMKNKIKKAGIFGSYATGEERPESDVDILIEPYKGMGFQFFGLQMELEKTLKKRVDLVSYKGISPYLKKRILEQEIKIL